MQKSSKEKIVQEFFRLLVLAENTMPDWEVQKNALYKDLVTHDVARFEYNIQPCGNLSLTFGNTLFALLNSVEGISLKEVIEAAKGEGCERPLAALRKLIELGVLEIWKAGGEEKIGFTEIK